MYVSYEITQYKQHLFFKVIILNGLFSLLFIIVFVLQSAAEDDGQYDIADEFDIYEELQLDSFTTSIDRLTEEGDLAALDALAIGLANGALLDDVGGGSDSGAYSGDVLSASGNNFNYKYRFPLVTD